MTHDLAQAYLDDLLSDDERTAFESRIKREPALQSELDDHRRIDAALRDHFAPPSPEHLARLIAEAGGQTAARRPRFVITTAWRIAAALALTVVGLWLAIGGLRSNRTDSPYDEKPHRTVWEVYAFEQRDDFTPDWVCGGDVFEAIFRKRHGGSLRFNTPPDVEVAATGLAYANALSPRTTCVLLSSEGRNILVLVDRLDRDPRPDPAPRDGLFLHRRELAPLVLYEVSPFPAPRSLEYFAIPKESAP